jgi:hypothetical protein
MRAEAFNSIQRQRATGTDIDLDAPPRQERRLSRAAGQKGHSSQGSPKAHCWNNDLS